MGRRAAVADAHRAREIQDHGDPAVAHDGGAGEQIDAAVELTERLDDRLVAADHAIDDQADALALDADDHDLLEVGIVARDLEQLAQPDVGHELAAQRDDVAAVVRPAVGGGELEVLGDRRERHDEAVAIDLDEQAVDCLLYTSPSPRDS